jgi:hypothetical protein
MDDENLVTALERSQCRLRRDVLGLLFAVTQFSLGRQRDDVRMGAGGDAAAGAAGLAGTGFQRLAAEKGLDELAGE